VREIIVDNFAEALVRANLPELCQSRKEQETAA